MPRHSHRPPTAGATAERRPDAADHLAALGLASNLPCFPAGDGPFLQHPPGSLVARLGQAHALAMLACSAAALWEALRGWRDDLVASRWARGSRHCMWR